MQLSGTGLTDEQATGVKLRRAKDFVKCTDPECWINKDWMRWHNPEQWPNDRQAPHCHPVY